VSAVVSSSVLSSSFHFGFPVATVSELSGTAKLLKRRADAISIAHHMSTDSSLKAQQEKYSLYILASIFWLEHASVLVAQEVRPAHTIGTRARQALPSI